MEWEILEYKKPNGRSPVREFLSSLNAKHRAKVLRNVQLLKEFGLELGMPYTRHLEEGIWELRTQESGNISRVLLFHWYENRLVFTHGFIKKTQKTPREEIEKAKRYRSDFLERNNKE